MVLAALALALVQAAPAAAEPAPEIREVVVRGASRFTTEDVRKIVRLGPGDRLRRDPQEVAAALQARYAIAGYPAARVTGSFDPASGALALDVDEGRIAEVVVEGVGPKVAERARREVGLHPGDVLKEESLQKGLERLERASEGGVRAAGQPAYSVDVTPQGTRLVLKMQTPGFRWRLRPGGAGVAPLYNRVEGFAPWAGVEATVFDPVAFKNLDLYARGGYGFSSHDPRFVLGARRPLGVALTAGYEFHDLTDSDDVFRGRGLEQSDRLVVPFVSTQDFYRRRGHEAYLFKRLSARAQAGLTFRADRFESLAVTTHRELLSSEVPRPNPAIAGGEMRSVLATVRWVASGELFDGEGPERRAMLDRNLYATPFDALDGWRAEATAELAGLGGDLSFSRTIAHLRHYRSLTASQSLYVRGLVALTTGEVPPQRRLFLGGMGTLRGYDLKEFGGRQMALATAEWVLYPRSPLPRLIAFYDGGAVWGEGAGAGWKDDVGVGLDWPGSGPYVRVDLGVALRPEAGKSRTRLTGRLRLPF